MVLAPRGLRLPLATLALALPALAHAGTQTFNCGFGHFVRNGGTEMVSTTLSVRNADPANAATILRLTLRDGEGNVVHDSGPAAGSALPLNTDYPTTFPGGKDITQVAPGGVVYLRSNHLWGNNGMPTGAAGNETGQLMSATVLVAKDGPKSAVSVNSTTRQRARVPTAVPGTFAEAETRASSGGPCEAL